jgi:RNA polymerase sigma-70 factor
MPLPTKTLVALDHPQDIDIRELRPFKGRPLPPERPSKPRSDPVAVLQELELHLDSLYTASPASAWRLPRSQFVAAIKRSVAKRFAETPVTRQSLEQYLQFLHLDDLVLAAACMEGSEPAWDHFVKTYRGYLRAVACSITKNSRSGTDAQELADSLFAELFGLVDGKRGEASLFRYFHGRSSLKTWLRAILAQRHINRIRQSRRWESLEQEDGEVEKPLPGQTVSAPPLDPHRNRYLRRFLLALTDSLAAMQPDDRKRLELYYARGKTLAEIGCLLGEHESSVSRHLDRARRELRTKVEECLLTGRHTTDPPRALPPMSPAEVTLCFQYASEDSPVDFRQLFPEKLSSRNETGRKESS